MRNKIKQELNCKIKDIREQVEDLEELLNELKDKIQGINDGVEYKSRLKETMDDRRYSDDGTTSPISIERGRI